jgi:predicted transposase YbfD/YdcC
VENGRHWVLDMAFREDECRIHMGHAAANIARLRQMGLNLVKYEKCTRLGIKNKRLRDGWDDS